MRKLFVLSLLLLVKVVTNAQVIINSNDDFIKLEEQQISYFIAPQKTSSLQEIRSHLNEFKPVNSRMVNLGFETKDVWFYFETKNISDSRLIRMLKLSNPIIDEVDVYKRIGNNTFIPVSKGGDQRPFAWRYNGNRELIFPLKLDPHSTNGFLFRVNNGGEQFYFQSSLEKGSYIQVKHGNKQVFYGLLFGVMIFIIILNLAIGVLFRQRIAYIYTLYGASFTLLQMSLLGFGTTWLWTDQFFISNRANPIFATLGVFYFLNFTYRFLELKQNTPRILPFVRFIQISLLINLCISLIPGTIFMNISAITVNALTLILNLFIIYPLIITLRTGSKTAKSYLVAFSVLQISVFAFVLRNFGIIPNSFLADNGLQIGFAVEMIILTFAILQRFKLMNDASISVLAEANELKENLNIQLEAEVDLRTKEVIQQRNELEHKNEEITSSILYAKRIQNALLPSNSYYTNLIPNLNVFYYPKDIVAGDFYWIKRIRIGEDIWKFVAVADCTGHGVPGAMMSVLCMNALNESSRLLEEADPADLLTRVSTYLRNYLLTDGMELSDGMDISVVCFNSEKKIMRFCGANNPLWILNETEIKVIPPTKRPVGKSESSLAFVQHEMTYHPNERILLFSDGCIDQFGEKTGKKLKTPGLKKMVIDKFDSNPTTHLKNIEKGLLEWMGKEEQLDDICMMLIDLN
ncbi:7TM diverse intracellular signaling domain-containing protein [Fluviicola taffensis]|uniref:Protein serine/threonine phosphatase n=1 Tax=Fluviicola taffensis (strain DSM 16823 / NCIMB 13979 / RW262) TaxID=755732 RepID=F2II15_FLUTR|nr:7TM diverse intracellular signaling domain-containing protein [Fluviicola taffensis]AEA42715.1 protein serine/threonine phosphatase [Fluviicola taffensis DSM 16823]